MTDSMNFGPDWIRNLSSEGTTASSGGGLRYQLADYRYGREEMLALFDKSVKPPPSLTHFSTLYSEQTLLPLALLPTTDEEQRGWQPRPTNLTGPPRGRGGPLERGGRMSRGGRGGYQSYGRPPYESGWGNGEQPDWSPRKEYSGRGSSLDNWRRGRLEDDDGWRNINHARAMHEKWGRSPSWRGEGDSEERTGPSERGGRSSWHELNRPPPSRRSWDNEDHLPEWATENPAEGGGTFDSSGAFHGSDDEQSDSKFGKKEPVLQKSTSQQQISTRTHHPPQLSTSKSAVSLSKPAERKKEQENFEPNKLVENKSVKENGSPEKGSFNENVPEKIDNEIKPAEEGTKEPVHDKGSALVSNGPVPNTSAINKDEEEFARLQEDLVLKLVVDEDVPKTNVTQPVSEATNIQPPPNLTPPSQELWYYQDPQGQLQGPFPSAEMADWYKAGYFNAQLKVRRPCDDKFFFLGELVLLCEGGNPFQTNSRFPPNKADPAKLPEPDITQLQYLMALQQMQNRTPMEPWNTLTLQQQELATQRLMMHPQVPQDLSFIHQSPPSNPLMHMLNQMQANKLPGAGLVDKPTTNVPNQLDPLMVQMSNMQSLHNRIATPGISSHLPAGLPAGLPTGLPPEGLGLPGMMGPHQLSGLSTTVPTNLASALNISRTPHPPHPPVEQLSKTDSDPISSLLKQLQQQKQQQQQSLDSLWKHSHFSVAPSMPQPPQWQATQEAPIPMWDIPRSTESPLTTPLQQEPSKTATEAPTIPTPPEKPPVKQEKKEQDQAQKDLKKKKELEEKQAKKDQEEKRKQEQRKQEIEKKAAEEKKKKEEERIKKELEKAKKEAEDKRLKELEEKRRLKEIRKAEEEARKKMEDQKKLEDERLRREMKERDEFNKKEAARLAQEQALRAAKAAPWSQSGSSQGLSLTEIQKLEKEKRAQEVLLQQKQQQMQEQFLQHQEKPSGIHLSWANKPVEPRKVKSLAEIQAEEQERLAKQMAEARLIAQQKEKETPVVQNTGNIWNSQNLCWSNASASQWQASAAAGFWDDPQTKPISNKPSTISKSRSTTTFPTNKQPAPQQPQQQQQKAKQTKNKKEESSSAKTAKDNGNSADEFTNWCYRTLSSISSEVDIPTFVTFLRDIESALDVKEYCKEYLGDSPATQNFASSFLEKRRSCKPKSNLHKDDMCSPAPAITPSLHNNTEFQEVKGKNKKNRKNRMLKVDSRILGFNVTSDPDRINVGDRDYGDTS